MDTHVKILAGLFIVLSALGTLGAFFVATVSSVITIPFLGLAGIALSVYLLAVSLPGLMAGIGLLQFKPWARVLAIVLSALHLVNYPFGTAAGIYGLYVLLSEEGSRLFKPVPPAPPAPVVS